MTHAWRAVLDELEAAIDRAEDVLASNGEAAVPPAFTPPAVPGPVPAELRARAQALVDRATGIEAALAAAAAATRGQLARLPRLTAVHDPVSRLDVQA